MGADSSGQQRNSPVTDGIRRHPLLVVGFAPMLAVLVSVIFNVWYSVVYIAPLLTTLQLELLQRTLLLFNLVAFPVAGALWGALVGSLREPMRSLRERRELDQPILVRAQARAINLPWHFSAIVAIANAAVGVVLYWVVSGSQQPVFDAFYLHLLIAIVIAALITITIAFFLIELLVLLLVFPVLFADARPYETRGALPLSLTLRALLMAVAGSIGPIVMLLLIGWADDAQRGGINLFRLAVGLLGVGFAFVSAWLFSSLVMSPLRKLSRASRQVADGNLDTRIDLLRADEFGSLVDEFNHMVGELGEKQRLRETFGLHVGERAAVQILASDPGLGGQLLEITVLFCDIRGFTADSAGRAPEEVVSRLNAFLETMVEIVEGHHGGLINKFLGDGFMALFGAGDRERGHAEAALSAARAMLAAPGPFKIGIGIHTGPAIVGNIGSPRRLEYTAIGETVNLAARLEALTKLLSAPLLFSRATREHLPAHHVVRALGVHPVRGQPEPVEVFSVED
jgi:adenylate cyclase